MRGRDCWSLRARSIAAEPSGAVVGRAGLLVFGARRCPSIEAQKR